MQMAPIAFSLAGKLCSQQEQGMYVAPALEILTEEGQAKSGHVQCSRGPDGSCHQMAGSDAHSSMFCCCLQHCQDCWSFTASLQVIAVRGCKDAWA